MRSPARGIVDYTSRLAADVLKTSYFKRCKESTNYFALVWGLVLIGCIVLLVGLAQPIVLLVISACVGGAMMVIYSALLIVLNRKVLPAEIGITKGRIAALGWAFLLFGVSSVLTIIDQVASWPEADRTRCRPRGVANRREPDAGLGPIDGHVEAGPSESAANGIGVSVEKGAVVGHIFRPPPV